MEENMRSSKIASFFAFMDYYKSNTTFMELFEHFLTTIIPGKNLDLVLIVKARSSILHC